MQNLPQERMSIAVSAAAGTEAAIDTTLQYCRDRKAFGKQLHGGYGYMTEYPIAKAYLDARVQTIGLGLALHRWRAAATALHRRVGVHRAPGRGRVHR